MEITLYSATQLEIIQLSIHRVASDCRISHSTRNPLHRQRTQLVIAQNTGNDIVDTFNRRYARAIPYFSYFRRSQPRL